MLFSVFVTGAAVLIIEVTAVRILSPYFGNTIFTVSSVISVILAALSLGYYVGGRLADRYPSLNFFYGIIFAGGLSIIFLRLLISLFLPTLGYGLSLVNGPLISALLLFFLPSFLLGTLSPFAIKLQKLALPDEGIGKVSGQVFFWSTFGSIFGSLFSGFALIPQFGVNQIIIGVGAFLMALSIIALLVLGISQKLIIKLILVMAIGIGLIISLSSLTTKTNALYSHDGVYEKLIIFDSEFNGRPVRFFQQDRSNSGAMFLDSDELVYDYTKYYTLYQVFKPKIKESLIIGGGAYSIPKAILDELPDVNVDVAEIEPSLFDLGGKFFKVPDSKRLKNYLEDGRRFLHDVNKKYDLIISDVYYSLYSIPAHFTTEEFFKIVKDKLENEGIFIANLIGDLSRQPPSLIFSEIKTFQSAFPNSYFFAVESPKSLASQNIIFVGYNSNRKVDFNNLKIKESKNQIIRTLSEKLIDLNRYDFSPYPKLTDNFSPVEYLTAKILKNNFDEKSKSANGEEMMALISQQLRFGPRFLSATGHKKVQAFLISEMSVLASETKIQKWQHESQDGTKNELINIIGRFYPENKRKIIIGTHYDSKKFAEYDLKNREAPVPGANDSASGVAVLLEIGRHLADAKNKSDMGIDLVFFDGEEGEESLHPGGWKPLGSTYFAENLAEFYKEKPISGVVVDMVCKKNLTLLKERSSVRNAPSEVDFFWDLGRRLYPKVFQAILGPEIQDDHTPLNNAGIPSFLIIDFNYPPFHTAEDTIDKCSADSLETVANSVISYINTLK